MSVWAQIAASRHLAVEPYRRGENLDIYRATILVGKDRVKDPFYQGTGLLAIDSEYETPTGVFVSRDKRGEANAERYLMRLITQTRDERAKRVAEIAEEADCEDMAIFDDFDLVG